MGENRSSRTKASGNRIPNGATPDPDDTKPADAHWHGHTPDLHARGGADHPHYMRPDGQNEYGSWTPPGTLPYEYLGDRPGAHPDDHRHDGTAVGKHEDGKGPHRHDPEDAAVIPLDGQEEQPPPAALPPYEYKAPAFHAQAQGTYTAEVEASQARLPADPPELTPEQRNQLTPGQRDQLKDYYQRTLTDLDGSGPAPLAVPVREGVSRPGTSIAHPGAFSLLNTIHGVTDDALNHEMTWLDILAPLVIEAATFHADGRAEGGTGPELAPMELWMRARDAMEHIVQPRLAREARP